ncbi:amylo-alpha-1,6-glucosidase, partial [uncultured Bilophila sp.]
TLAPSAPDYHSLYEGGPAQRDEAYHQGTVWPWLLGAYAETVLRAAWDVPGSVRELLRTVRPLFAQHLGDAGMGSVSEIFDGDPPHLPNGCIAQAWSVAECLRLLRLLKEAAPEVYAEWEADARKGGK